MLLSFNTNFINWGNTLSTHIATNQHAKVSSLFSHKTIQPPPHLSTSTLTNPQQSLCLQ